jgi:prepilin-type N-terminal cleavage/methylation domain-containing protein
VKTKNTNGFTLIEVLVAATILVIIVMMLGSLFQQTSTAWRTGTMRTGGYMQLRAYIGAIQKDASAMIDANLIPENMLCNGDHQNFSSSEIQFYTLTGGDEARALNFITYSTSGIRTQRTLKLNQPGDASADAAWDSKTSANILQIRVNQTANIVNPLGFTAVWSDDPQYDFEGKLVSGKSRRFPLYVSVKAEIGQSGDLYDVGAVSGGPDGTIGSARGDPRGADDIRTFTMD